MRPYYWFCRFICQWVSILYCRVRVFNVRHVPQKGGVLIISNHQSFLDPVLAGMGVPREMHFMARDTLFDNPGFGRLIRSVNAFPVRRGEADISAIKETLRRLRDGQVVLLFPEGTRSEDGTIKPFMAGVGSIARKAGVPVVPALVDGVFQAWPKGQALPLPCRVIVEYGEPLLPEQITKLTPEQIMDELRRRVVQMQHKWHSRVPSRRLKWWKTGPEETTGSAEPSLRLVQSA